ncbi:MAG: 4Fe-4S dicluster domain-containing protein [Prevotellaceae bacterium]|jgi:2-oxoglutarate ferredoxin oxidoreductase subunit delta|nr:4Fe-4S dicluster domain-containing protein [Prevotellaceae bacterium]
MKQLSKIRTAYVWANTQNCTACWKCIDACPKKVIGKVGFLWHKHIIIKNVENCIGCKTCIKTCSQGVFSEKMPDLLKSILNRKGII